MSKNRHCHQPPNFPSHPIFALLKKHTTQNPIPNHLSTYRLRYIFYLLFGEYDGAGGVEKRGGGSGVEGCISTPIPNYLSTPQNLRFYHNRVVRMKGKERCGEHTCSYHHIRVMMSVHGGEW